MVGGVVVHGARRRSRSVEPDDASTRSPTTFVRELAALSPLAAVYLGLPSDRLLDDLSPDGLAEQAELARRTLAAAGEQPIETERRPGRRRRADRTTAAAPRPLRGRRLPLGAQRHRLAGAGHRACCSTCSPRTATTTTPTSPRGCGRCPSVRRLRREPARGRSPRPRVGGPPGRQVRRAVRHLLRRDGDGDGYFTALAAASERTGALADELAAAAAVADAAYADLAAFLRSELRQHAPEKDAVGREVYALASRDFLGATVDLEETYDWGWQEFLGLEAELKEVCARIRPGATPREVVRPARRRRRATRSPAPTGCSGGCRSCPTAPSPSSAAPTSTSPSRSARSTARSPRRAARSAPTTPGRATTCHGRGRCGGRSSRAARCSRRGARPRSSTTRAFPAITCRSPRPCTSGTRSTTSSACSPARAGTPRGGRCTPNG